MYEETLEKIKSELLPVKEQERKADDVFRYLDEKLQELKVETPARIELTRTAMLDYNTHNYDDISWRLRIADPSGRTPICNAKREYKFLAVYKLEALLNQMLENIRKEVALFKSGR